MYCILALFIGQKDGKRPSLPKQHTPEFYFHLIYWSCMVILYWWCFIISLVLLLYNVVDMYIVLKHTWNRNIIFSVPIILNNVNQNWKKWFINYIMLLQIPIGLIITTPKYKYWIQYNIYHSCRPSHLRILSLVDLLFPWFSRFHLPISFILKQKYIVIT